MAVTGTVQGTIAIPAQPGLSPLNYIFNLSNASAVGQQTIINLTTTPTAITIPTGALYAWIQGPAGNTANILYGNDNSGAAHMQITHPTNPTMIAFIASSPVMYMACSAGNVAVTVIWI